MKAKKGGAVDPEISSSEPDGVEGWTGLSKEETLKAERQIAARMATGMAFWAASLEAYNTMVQEWTQSRQTALWRSMKSLSDLNSQRVGSNG